MSPRWVVLHDGGAWDGTARAAFTLAERLGAGEARVGTPADGALAARATRAGIPVTTWPADAPARARRDALSGLAPDGWVATTDSALAQAAALARRAGRGAVIRRVAVGERMLGGRRRWFASAPLAAYVFAARGDAERAVLPSGAVRGGIIEPWVAPTTPRRPASPPHVALVAGADVTAAHVALRGAAALLAAHPAVRLVVLGAAGRDDALRVHAGALGIGDRLVTGGDFDADPWLATAAAAWVVAEGDDGAFGALATASHGVPVLAARGSAAARVIVPGSGGETIPGDEPLVGASVLARWLGDATLRRTLGHGARERLGILAPPPVGEVLTRALTALRGPRAGAA